MLVLVAAVAVGNAAQSAVLAEGPHLFIDDFLIAKSRGLTRTTHQPERVPVPVLAEDRPVFYLKVLHDADLGRHRMWYNKMDPVLCYAYAESWDGIAWSRPDVGLVEISGSKANNVIDAPRKSFGFFMVDEGRGYSPPARRYKIAFYKQKGGGIKATGMWVAFSADGMRFSEPAGGPVIPEYAADGTSVISDIIEGVWDPFRSEYLVACKQWGSGYPGKAGNAKDGMRRVVGLTTSKDFISWEKPVTIVRPDPANGMEEFYGFKPLMRGNLYLGFLRVLRDDLPADRDGPVQGIGWTELMTSRDGRNWLRHRDRFLDRDPRTGEWDHAMAWYADCLTVGDQEYIYYGGYSTGHKGGERKLGLGILRKNGFVSRDAGREGGTLTTPPVALAGRSLLVNANVRDELRVRLIDARGQALPGFDWPDCIPLRGDSVSHRLAWRGGSRMPAGDRVSIEFSLRNAELYGFDLEPAKNE